MSDANDDWPGRRFDHVAFAAALAEPQMQRKASDSRPKSNKALLAAFEQTGKRW